MTINPPSPPAPPQRGLWPEHIRFFVQAATLHKTPILIPGTRI